MAQTTSLSVNAGKRLLPLLIDEIAASHPKRVFASIPLTNEPSAGFRDVSFADLAQAIDRCSWWVEKQLECSISFETVAYIGPLDLLYHILALACVKTGHKLFLPSPRNSLDTQLILLEKTDCKKFIFPDPPPPAVSQVLKGTSIESLAIPSLDHFLEPGESPAFSYEKTFDQARYEPLVVLHTSGSSGIPKPITVTHGSIATMDAYHLISSRGEREVLGPSFKGTRMLMTFPMFHMASFTLLLGLGVYYDVIGMLPPAGEPLSAVLVDAILEHGNIQGAALPPSIIVDLYKRTESFERLCDLDYVLYAGGPLPKEVGDALSSRTHLASTFGSTETAYPPLQVCDSADWEYVSYSPVFGSDFRPVGADGLYEQWLVRQKDLDLFQSIFATYPDRQEFSTQDLYEKHPTKAGLWRFRGRTDDLIVFSNAEKFNPTDFETALSMYPLVKSALVGGQGRFQPFLLIEPNDDLETVQARGEYGESVWLLVETLNRNSPTCGQIMKDFLLLVEPGRPFPRAGKGTVQRKAAFRLYEKEIDNLYIRPELPKMPRQMLLDGAVDGQTTLPAFLRKLVRSNLGTPSDFNDDADFFDLGLDSLHVVDVAKRTNAYIIEFELDLRKVDPAVIYARPSIRRLVEYVEGRDSPVARVSRESRMQTMFDKYSSPSTSCSEPKTPPCKSCIVLMTGSTGSVGSYILDLLIKHPKVAKIYCTTRDQAGPARQKKSFQKKSLDLNLDKVKFVPCDLSRYRLGLTEAVREEVLDEITHVLHVAWDINFNRSLESFEDTHVAGVRNLLDFSLEAKHRIHFLFTSTFATATGWGNGPGHAVPEKILDDWTASQELGYAGSKLVAERLIGQCGQGSWLKTTICRLGQVAGPSKGAGQWNRDEWIPSMVASSTHLGLLPQSLGPQDRVDWVPVDKVASILVDVLAADLNIDLGENKGAKRKRTQSPVDEDEPGKSRRITRSGKLNLPQVSVVGGGTKVLHVVNPSTTTWSAMCEAIQSSSKTSLDRVDFSIWLEALRKSAPEHVDKDTMRANPALKLLTYLELLAGQSSKSPIEFETSEAAKLSPTMASLGAVTGEHMATWMRQWGLA